MADALPFVRAVKQSVFVAANMLRFNTRPDLHKCCLWRKGRIYMGRLLSEAIIFAANAHEGQFRKGINPLYFTSDGNGGHCRNYDDR